MDKEERVSLESNAEDAKLQKDRRGGVKVNSNNSMFTKKTATKENFEKQAAQLFEDIQDKKTTAVELVQQFWGFVKDETLPYEKGPISKNLEKEIVAKLINFATSLNNDPKEAEGAGSVAVITLLLKAVLYFRDCNNDTRYRLSELERKVKKMSSQSI